MDVTTYLTARGWKRCGAFPGSGADRWYDTFGRGSIDVFRLQGVVEPVHADRAHEIQLNRDAELRDHVDAMRPRPGGP